MAAATGLIENPRRLPANLRRLSAPPRAQGVDLARGLAVLGMLAAHLLVIAPFQWRDPSTWVDVVNGRSSILFATLAGVSLALSTGGARRFAAERMRVARRRIVVRAGLLWLLGVALIATGVPIIVILPAYGILFLLAAPLLTVSVPVLWGIAVGAAVTVPWVLPLWNVVLSALPASAELAQLIGWHYPFPLWIAFVAAGLAVGRSAMASAGYQAVLLVGAGLVAAGAFALAVVEPADPYLRVVWSADAHSSGLGEAVGSGAFALAVLAACLLVCRTPLTWILLPLRAVGSMPLTAYTGQILAWAVVATVWVPAVGDGAGMRELDPFLPFASTTIVLCTAWTLLWGRGPLERLVAAVSSRLVAQLDR